MKLTAIVLSTWLALALQLAISPTLSHGEGGPNFPLIVLAVSAMSLGRRGGAVLGFCIGACVSALSQVNMTHLAVTYTLTGFALAWSGELRLEPSYSIAAILAAAGTLFALLSYMMLAPPNQIFPHLVAIIQTVVYDGIFAIPVYLLLRRFLFATAR